MIIMLTSIGKVIVIKNWKRLMMLGNLCKTIIEKILKLEIRLSQEEVNK